MEYHEAQPRLGYTPSVSMTLEPMMWEPGAAIPNIATPANINSAVCKPTTTKINFRTPTAPAQAIVDADPQLKRLQQDLLVLSSFNENETLHWRPTWFKQGRFAEKFWTLQNPPNVVTERLPHIYQGRQYYTRRMRRNDDAPPTYIKSWAHWERYCDLYGVPHSLFCEKNVELLRLGLPRNSDGVLCAPPSYPLYPEPQPTGRGRYMLDPSTYISHLPRKFHSVRHMATQPQDVEVVVVHSNGALVVEPREAFFMHSSQYTHFDGYGGYRVDAVEIVDQMAPKDQGPGRRWSYLPWTKEQECSCKSFKLTLRLKPAVQGGGCGGWKMNEGNKMLDA